MSSTNRGGERAEKDFYPTPAFAVHRLLDRLALPPGRWLELGAGDGAIMRAVASHHAAPSPIVWTAVELRPECRPVLEEAGARDVVIGSAQEWARRRAFERERFDVCVMNPPFSDALTFVQVALRVARIVVCLERSPWIGDEKERYAYFRQLMPDEYRVGRVDFDGRGGDSIPYSWFVWGDGDRARTAGRLELLEPTPSQQRVRGDLPPPRQLGLLDGGR